MGCPVSPDTVVSSARATALYLREHDPAIRRVLVLGGSGLERELRDAGYDVVTSGVAATRMSQESIDGFAAAGNPDAVVVGLDPNLTYARLVVASDSIRAGAHFIATNRTRSARPSAVCGRVGIARHRAGIRDGVVPVSIETRPFL
jgi:ribonucleotide monophosphatase NagD (HAD superfamily)